MQEKINLQVDFAMSAKSNLINLHKAAKEDLLFLKTSSMKYLQ